MRDDTSIRSVIFTFTDMKTCEFTLDRIYENYTTQKESSSTPAY